MSSFKAENIIHDKLDSAELSLSGMRLTSLDALVPLLAKMPHLRCLNVSHNELHDLPMDLSALAKLETLDLSSNPLGGVRPILHGLQSLPRLSSLSVSFPAPAEETEEQLVMKLPTLTCLNGITLVDPTEGEEEEAGAANRDIAAAARTALEDNAYWTTTDSAGIENLFADVSRQDAFTTQEFFDYMNRVVQHVSCLTAAEEDAFAQEGEVLKARRLLYEFCFGDVIRHAFKDGYDVLGRQLQALQRYESAMMDQYDTHWRRILRDRNSRLARTKRDVQDAMEDIRSLVQHVPEEEAHGSLREVEDLGRGREEAPCGGRAGASASHGATPLASTRNTTHMDVSRLGVSPQPLPPAGFTQLSQRLSSEPKARRPTFTKVLSLKQLKEIIEDIYTSKVKYDGKCKQNQLPRETMEQHMYTYLNQKYGLREIILEWATAIVEAVRRYAPEDNDVAVFGKVLRNEVDEEFRFVQQHVREAVKELLHMHIRAKRPHDGVMELNRALQKLMNSPVAEDAWKEVVNYMYNADDTALITSIIHQYLYRQSSSKLQRRRKEELRLSPTAVYPQLLCKDFVRLLLDFQLDGHVRFLEPYVEIFRRHDRDQNGIVNGFEFASIVRELDSSKSEEAVKSMVREIDPHGSQLITFSDSIAFLNDELLKLFSSQHDTQ
ncbi:Leucine rich repeat/Leucine Rich Repeat/Leucine Rich repeats (2 copies), putative [Leishmania guyanensis]|uniref:EF-hand domain-containing protein n=1 Tax=Leishmania guyanensis TaxID=5670 RepID=A0A1E1IY92_LEIGU|nr:hypothetical protein, conserved [Leishmania guyanensis]